MDYHPFVRVHRSTLYTTFEKSRPLRHNLRPVFKFLYPFFLIPVYIHKKTHLVPSFFLTLFFKYFPYNMIERENGFAFCANKEIGFVGLKIKREQPVVCKVAYFLKLCAGHHFLKEPLCGLFYKICFHIYKMTLRSVTTKDIFFWLRVNPTTKRIPDAQTPISNQLTETRNEPE